MDFAKNILSKYGWQDGDGLGKEKQGIKKPIKANLKFDQAGLGAAPGSEFGNNWWERCFNDAAQNVQVQKEQNGKVIVDLKDADNSVEVSTKGYSVKKLKDSGSGVYGNNFLSSDVAVTSFAMTKYKVLTDEELFQACGGRTAHKGARHGLKLSGKLSRIEQQEKELLAKMQKNKTTHIEIFKKSEEINNSATNKESCEEKPKTKKKRSKDAVEESQPRKKKNNNLVEENSVEESLQSEENKSQMEKNVENSNVPANEICHKQKKKKKGKTLEANLEEINEANPDENSNTADKAHKKNKRTKLNEEDTNQVKLNENQTQKKKKKRKSAPVEGI